ncbi:Transcription elongation factor SPT4 [Mycena indigotica]|uniref:Transcription elongation factor SPT4 n=1 Tax=Mycena indigotica TaxID=2126181 RepID=A0A8H6SLX2_9AGAR|nr:Transcription elongation factor SPT4 [Mycena indigotica]KAF7301237.1 Transcription elongation factor SPT4 [Mycena indigotica]
MEGRAPIPTATKGARQLRACLLCSIVLQPIDFRRQGCPNCEEILQMKNSGDRIASCTTTYFDGVIAVIDPENSWVAKWQRTSKYVIGMYAARVKGQTKLRWTDSFERKVDLSCVSYTLCTAS